MASMEDVSREEHSSSGVAPVISGDFENTAEYPYPPFSTGMAVPQDHENGGEESDFMQKSHTVENSNFIFSQDPSAGPVARPPPQVMTALGPMPLPPEIRRKIPEKFVAKPIIEEREIYIAKKEVQERTIEIPHVHYEHKFAEIAKNLKIKKLVPTIKEIIKEVPREVYKPVIEEKVIEVPQGVKYVEVPVEVPCNYPPKIVPKPQVQVVERVVETIKPIVKEKIIEVPQTVVKQIPKIKTVEVPYYVPRYVEKIIEIPYQPPESGGLPPSLLSGLPASFSGNFPGHFNLGPIPLDKSQDINLPFEARIDVNVSQGSFLSSRLAQSEAAFKAGGGTFPSIDLPQGFQWGSPPNAPPIMQPFGNMGCPPGAPPPSGLPGGGLGGSPNMPPLMVTCPPEVGNVQFAGYLRDPDILTRRGVMAYTGFRQQGNFQMLFPPLPPQQGVPINPAGVPDVQTIDRAQGILRGKECHPLFDNLKEQQEAQSTGIFASCMPCQPDVPREVRGSAVYE